MKFLKLDNVRDNIVRCVKNPWQYLAHGDYVANGNPDHGIKLKCSLGFDSKCAICDHTRSIPEARWMVPVFFPKDCNVQLMDIGSAIFYQLRQYQLDSNWGNLDKYNCNIHCPNGDWKVNPQPPYALSETEKNWINTDYEEGFLKMLVTPPSYSETVATIQYQDYRPFKMWF